MKRPLVSCASCRNRNTASLEEPCWTCGEGGHPFSHYVRDESVPVEYEKEKPNDKRNGTKRGFRRSV